MSGLFVSSSPHIRNDWSTTKIMGAVIIALIPMVISSFLVFGPRALLVYATAVISAVVFEYISCKVMRRAVSVGDLSAVVTGLLLAACLPVDSPPWMTAFGSLVAIVVVKMMFGGIGQNFANPAIVGRVVLMVAFPATMASYGVLPQYAAEGATATGMDTVTSATPLALHDAGIPVSYMDLFLGTTAGSIGEVSALALLIGGIFLIVIRVTDIWIPLSYIGSVAVVALIAGDDPIFHVLSGGLILGAFFMANDYTTSPLTTRGKIIFGIGAGLLTALIRVAGYNVESVAFSILFMNLLTPVIDRYTETKPVGGVKHA